MSAAAAAAFSKAPEPSKYLTGSAAIPALPKPVASGGTSEPLWEAEKHKIPQSMLQFYDRPILAFARVPRGIPEDHLARMVVWMRANTSSPGFIASEDDIAAAKGINLQDLVPRVMILVFGLYRTVEEARGPCMEVSEILKCNVQTLHFGDWTVIPPYTTSGVIYGEEEVATFMKSFSKSQRMDRAAFDSRVASLGTELTRNKAMRNTVTQEQIDAEDKAKNARDANLPTTRGLFRDVTDVDDAVIAETQRVLSLKPEADDTDPTVVRCDWRDLARRTDDPNRTLSLEASHRRQLIAVRNRSIATLQANIVELEKEIAEIESVMRRDPAPGTPQNVVSANAGGDEMMEAPAQVAAGDDEPLQNASRWASYVASSEKTFTGDISGSFSIIAEHNARALESQRLERLRELAEIQSPSS